jgi:hypothetical protein
MSEMTHAAVLESTYRPPTTEPAEAYTTAQEIAWLDDLAKRRRSDVLLNLRAAYEVRSWRGAGMRVDGDAVMEHLDVLIVRVRAKEAKRG